MRLLFTHIESADPRQGRLIGVFQGVVTNLGGRVAGILVNFLSVPFTIAYLGPERYGAWITLGSFLAWLSLSDLGLGNGLMNAVSSAVGQERPDLVRKHVANAMLLLTGLSISVGALTMLVWPLIDWHGTFGVTGALARAEIGPAMMAAVIIFLAQFPLALIPKIYLAHREGRIDNYWGIAANLLSLLALIAVTHTRGGLLWLVIAVSGTGLAVNIANFIWLFWWHRPDLRPSLTAIDFAAMPAVLNAGGQFLIIQTLALIVFQTDNIIISHYIGASRVPEYNLTYRLFDYALLPQTVLANYLWPAFSEAIARGDVEWVKRSFRLTLTAGGFFTLSVAFGLTFIARPFIGWWATPAFEPDCSLVVWMSVWSMINALMSPMACLFSAASHLRAQTIYSTLATIVNIILSIKLAKIWGLDGVIAGTVISHAVFVCLPASIDSTLLLRKLEHAL